MARDYSDMFEGLADILKRKSKRDHRRDVRKVSDTSDTSSPMPAATIGNQSAEFLNTGRMQPSRVAEL